MSNLVQNQNQTFQTPMLGQVTTDPQPQVVPAQIDPASTTITPIVAGCPVKLVAAAGPNVIVDLCASASDGPVFGVIPYNLRKNIYAVGDQLEVCCVGSYLMLKCAAAINRGVNVSGLIPAVSTDDPTVVAETTIGNYILGVTVSQIAAAGLVKVRVSPGKVTSTGIISVTP